MTDLILPLGAEPASAVETAGQKAQQLSVLAQLGLPVPPGFVVTAAACRSLGDGAGPALQEALRTGLANLEAATGRTLGGSGKPLIFSVRPSPLRTVPSPVEAVLNLGLNDVTVEALGRESNDPRFAHECYRRLIQNYAHVVLGDDPSAFEDLFALYREERGYVSETEIRGVDAKEIAQRFKAQFESNNGKAFEEDPLAQLEQTLVAMARAWNGPRAKAQRKLHGVSEDLGDRLHRSGHGLWQWQRGLRRGPCLVARSAFRAAAHGRRVPASRARAGHGGTAAPHHPSAR
ncbi:MAG: hypothetical protein U1E15_14190 [Hyphomicrobiales bacterium]